MAYTVGLAGSLGAKLSFAAVDRFLKRVDGVVINKDNEEDIPAYVVAGTNANIPERWQKVPIYKKEWLEEMMKEKQWIEPEPRHRNSKRRKHSPRELSKRSTDPTRRIARAVGVSRLIKQNLDAGDGSSSSATNDDSTGVQDEEQADDETQQAKGAEQAQDKEHVRRTEAAEESKAVEEAKAAAEKAKAVEEAKAAAEKAKAVEEAKAAAEKAKAVEEAKAAETPDKPQQAKAAEEAKATETPDKPQQAKAAEEAKATETPDKPQQAKAAEEAKAVEEAKAAETPDKPQQAKAAESSKAVENPKSSSRVSPEMEEAEGEAILAVKQARIAEQEFQKAQQNAIRAVDKARAAGVDSVNYTNDVSLTSDPSQFRIPAELREENIEEWGTITYNTDRGFFLVYEKYNNLIRGYMISGTRYPMEKQAFLDKKGPTLCAQSATRGGGKNDVNIWDCTIVTIAVLWSNDGERVRRALVVLREPGKSSDLLYNITTMRERWGAALVTARLYPEFLMRGQEPAWEPPKKRRVSRNCDKQQDFLQRHDAAIKYGHRALRQKEEENMVKVKIEAADEDSRED